MDLVPSRLRRGEWIVGASGLVLLASMFAFSWYGLAGTIAPTAQRLGVATTVNGWNGLSHLRWLILLTVLSALLLVFFQASRRAPAIPVSFSVFVTVLALITLLALVYRVLINQPGSDNLIELKPGAYVALISAVVLTYGGYESMRTEGIRPGDGPAEIETVTARESG